ncbi:MAG: NAD-glutamate dehydrogenase, partial [Alphaproteobacteria bacterium]|nr:NAD-glutamate dehydrogenase [Alphaproteobacteria bacterium]
MSRAQIIKDTVKALPQQSSKAIQDFAHEFFARVPDDDLVSMTPSVMARVTADHWDMMHKREPGKAIIRTYTRAMGEGEGSLGHTIINIVNDDMAFLVDSVAAEIARHGRIINQLVHPILHVTHDKNGRINSVSAQGSDKTHAQSHMHIEVIGSLPDALLKQIEKDLYDVLRDVRFATSDWLKIKDKLLTAQKGLSNAPASYPKDDIAEYLSFLEYLYRDNFTLLGCRETRLNDKGEAKIVPSSSLGVLSDKIKPPFIDAHRDGLPPEGTAARSKLPPVTITKVNKPSTVHRRVPMDAITVKQFDEKGKVSGELVFLGLFTSVTYSRSINDVPLLRRKAEAVTDKSGFRPGSHNHKALRHILEKYPRDEVFQIETGDLLNKALSILLLQERQRIALYTRTDIFGRYISCLMYIPRDRYDSDLRLRFQHVLEAELGGTCTNFYTTLDDSPLARVIYMVYLDEGKRPKFNERAIEQKLQEIGRLWRERLADALLANFGDDDTQIRAFMNKYAEA